MTRLLLCERRMFLADFEEDADATEVTSPVGRRYLHVTEGKGK